MSSANRGQIFGFWWDDYVILNRLKIESTPNLSHLISQKIDEETKENDGGKEDRGENNINGNINGNEITLRMKESLLALKCEHMSSNGDRVHYSLMKSSPLFHQYLETIQYLHQLDLSKLTNDERKAFFINIYNSLVIHALVENMVKESDDSNYDRLRMYSLAAYQIGSNVYSLNDIEHGILRGNRCSPTPFSSHPFSSNDPRLQYVVELDPRIHFALNCGARSCPNIKVYVASKLDRQLQLATHCYLSNISINRIKKTITVSMLFKWYRKDFGQTELEIIRWIENHATEDIAQQISVLLKENSKKKESSFFSTSSSSSSSSLQLSYFPYDWSINS